MELLRSKSHFLVKPFQIILKLNVPCTVLHHFHFSKAVLVLYLVRVLASENVQVEQQVPNGN